MNLSKLKNVVVIPALALSVMLGGVVNTSVFSDEAAAATKKSSYVKMIEKKAKKHGVPKSIARPWLKWKVTSMKEHEAVLVKLV